MAGSVSCLNWQRLTLILVSIIVDLSESSYVWYVKSTNPELGATEIDCFIVVLFVADAIRALYQVYIDFYIQPTFCCQTSQRFQRRWDTNPNVIEIVQRVEGGGAIFARPLGIALTQAGEHGGCLLEIFC